MSCSSISNPGDFEKSVCTGCTPLQFNGADCKDEDLNTGAGPIIVSSTDAVRVCPRARGQQRRCDSPGGDYGGGHESGTDRSLCSHEHLTALDLVLKFGEYYSNGPHAKGKKSTNSNDNAIASALRFISAGNIACPR